MSYKRYQQDAAGAIPDLQGPSDPLVYDIPTYCTVHKRSRSGLYNDWANGRGPDFYREGASIRITGAAAARHRAELERQARAEREAARGEMTP